MQTTISSSRMKVLYIGLFCISCLTCASSSRVKRYVGGNNQRGGNEWNWNRSGQLIDAQGKDTSQAAWPANKGSGGTSKGKGDSKTNRAESGWTVDGWSGADAQKDDYDTSWNNNQPQGNNKGNAYPDGGATPGGNLETLLRGVPGMDFPDFLAVPETDFDCSQMPSPRGYYGDVEAGCQVFHICQPGNRKDSFLCPVGTIFNQKYFVCDWWFNVNCSDTPSYYGINSDVYKETAVAPIDTPVTTEKTLPWNSQDLDKKRPTKSWGPPTPSGKQNARRADASNRRSSKSDNGSTGRDINNSWSRSDVQQKEVTLSWSSSAGTTSGNYGSPSIPSNSLIPTAKPIWYGIDGQPAKDQSNGVDKRSGLMHTAAPFGTRMRNSPMATAGTWTPTEVYESSTLSTKGNTFRPSSTTRNWLKGDELPETSIVPTEVKGVWEQESTRRVDNTRTTSMGHRGFVTKSNSAGLTNRKKQPLTTSGNVWGQRQSFRATSRPVTASTVSGRGWTKSQSSGGHSGMSQKFTNSEINSISRSKFWQ